MNLVIIAALVAVASAAKLDRTYLPPASAKTAGGSSESLQTPFSANSIHQQPGSVPKGGFTNDFQGVVVDAASPGTRASGEGETGLGASRISYGSTNSKVGDAAFRGTPAGFRQTPGSFSSNEDADVQTAGTIATAIAQTTSDGGFNQGFGSQNQGQSSQDNFSQGPQGFAQGSNSQGQGSRGPQNFGSQGIAHGSQEQGTRGSQNFAPQTQGFGSQGNYQRSQALSARDRDASILRFDSNVGTDSYSYSFETDNGISAEENGVATNGVHAQGGFSYTGDDGQVYSVTYTADEGGYQPKGDHLPTPPPIPEEILKSLEQNAREEAAGLVDDGSYDAQKYNTGSDYSDDGANTHNSRQPTNFGNRPESDATASGTFINQNNQPFVRPSPNSLPGQAGLNNGPTPGSNPFRPAHSNDFDHAQDSASVIQGNLGSSNTNAFGQANQGNVNGFQQNRRPQNVEVDDIEAQGHVNLDTQSFTRPTGFGQQTFNRKQNNNIPSASSPSFGQREQSSQSSFGSKNEYLPPLNNFGQNRRPSPTNAPQKHGSQTGASQAQGSPSFSQSFTNLLPSSEQEEEEKPQDSASSSAFVTPQTNSQFGVSQNNQFSSNGFRPSNSGTPSNGSPFKNQKATAQPLTELTTPFETSSNSQQGSSQNQAFTAQFEPGRPTKPSFENESHGTSQTSSFTTAFAASSPTVDSQSSNSRPFDSNTQQSPSFSSQRPHSQSFNQDTRQPQVQNGLSQNQDNDVQFASSTQKPSFSQNTQQGPDNSYYYNQPSTSFNTPNAQYQGSRRPSTSNQFNRIPQQASFSSQAQSGVSEQNFPVNNFGNRNGQGSRQPTQSTFSSPTPTPISATQGSTIPTFNGITQATASSFASADSTTSNQFGFNQRPNQQANQFNNKFSSQSQQTTGKQTTAIPQQFSDINRPQQNSFQNQQSQFNQAESSKDDSPAVPSQQYDGEIYEYNKPAETLPQPEQKENTASGQFGDRKPPSKPQFSQSQDSQDSTSSQTEIQTGQRRPQFSAPSRPQFGQQNQFNQNSFSSGQQFGQSTTPFAVQPTQPSFDENLDGQKSQNNQFNAVNRPQSLRPQFSQKPQSSQGSQFNQASQRPQFDQNRPRPCCKNLPSAPQTQDQSGQNQAQFVQDSISSAQGFKPQSTTQTFAGKGEVFGGPRMPPSFDETGYHY